MRTPHPASFRDPAGFVFRLDNEVHRQVNAEHAAQFEVFCASDLYSALVAEGLLVSHRRVDVPDTPPGAMVIRPEQVPFISYPYEWSPSQLQEAAIATLRIQQHAMDHGYTLRDASAFNVQFIDGRAVLIDSLSLAQAGEGRAWSAYGQFCRHFLAPLALAKYVDPRLLGILRDHLDGIPLDLASAILPSRTKWKPGLAIHLHAHARAQARHGRSNDVARAARVSDRAARGLVESLERTVRRMGWHSPRSHWSAYYSVGESYASPSMEDKRRIVAEMLDAISPSSLWDIGANTGEFSRLAHEITSGAVVALEVDPASVESNWREARSRGLQRLLPLVMDLSNPSPGIGWASSERESLAKRGPLDAAIVLAVVHHLAIGNNVPMPMIIDWLATMASHVVIEWVPKNDPMVREMLAGRPDVFPDYDQESFERAVHRAFSIVRAVPIAGSERVLYQLSR